MNLTQIFSRKVPNESVKSTSGDFKNLLKRKFNPDEPNRIWASDITYLKVGSKWYYLCVVIELFSRKVIDCLLSDKPDAKLVIGTFKKAYRNSNCPQGLLFHSERGTQYTCVAFRKFLYNLFPLKVVLLIMSLSRLFPNSSMLKRQTADIILPLPIYKFPCLSILTAFTT